MNTVSRDSTSDVILRTLTGEYPIANCEQLEDVAKCLSGILYRRSHWIGVEALRQEVGEKSRKLLEGLLGISSSNTQWEALARSGIIEVSMSPATSQVVRRFPWEFLLSSATEAARSEPSLVVRCLRTTSKKKTKKPIRSASPKLLVLRSLPGFLNEYYSSDSLQIEQSNVEANLGIRSRPPLVNPTLRQVQSTVAAQRPAILHVSGVDTIQAEQLRNDTAGMSSEPGMMLQAENGNPQPVLADNLASALCAATAKPKLISFNFHNSTPLGAAAVAHGAAAALCFQGEIDDMLAEIFFCNFYLAWRLSRNWNVLDAFRLAWQKLVERQRVQLHGTGIVLWSSGSLLDQERQHRENTRASEPVDQPPLYLQDRFDEHIERPAKLSRATVPLKVRVVPSRALNYSMLHNNRSPFEWFIIYKPQPMGRIDGVSVEVTLHVGEEHMPYNTVGSIDYMYWLVHEELRLPLTSVLARSVRESVYTSLFVKVQHKRDVLYEQTHRVKLLPIDQWQDDDDNRQWLPSFVLPRDAAIPRIVDCSQKYISLLADDYGAGFEGYQSKPEDVDQRVRGIWWTLIHDMPISYIAPPPTFGQNAQRLRSPSEVLETRRGTCVDLALLLASCLEYVDLYPVIFLLEGHAFPGYYRSEQTYWKVRDWALQESFSSKELWLFGQEFYGMLIQLVRQGELVPIETVGLTERRGFWDAIEQGGVNLRSKSSFQFMVDIKLARECDVTPLPL